MKGESRKGGRRREAEGEGNTIQTELCLTSLPPKRRKTDKIRLKRIEREVRGRAEGIKKKGDRDVQGLHHFLPTGNKKHCVREWELVSSHTWRVQ